MKEIAYISTPQGLVFDDDILAIVRESQVRNSRLGITGLLCYDGTHFFQIIEGPANTIDALYDAIRNDPRHTDIHTLSEVDVTVRSFSDWSMGYKRMDERLQSCGLLDAQGKPSSASDGVGKKVAAAFAA